MLKGVRIAEELGIDYLLVAQRWWGSGAEIEGSTYDCLAMTAFYAAQTSRIGLITAIHPGFFLPAAIAKWGATIDRLSGGRWSINVTSGWHEAEFGMFGAELLEHDERYARSKEFIEVMRRAWDSSGEEVNFEGRFYHDARPATGAAAECAPASLARRAITCRDRNGGATFGLDVPQWRPARENRRHHREGARTRDRIGTPVRFALYAIPLCRNTDAEAEAEIAKMVDAIDPAIVARRIRKDLRRARNVGLGRQAELPRH